MSKEPQKKVTIIDIIDVALRGLNKLTDIVSEIRTDVEDLKRRVGNLEG
jgi:hypothetical protein